MNKSEHRHQLIRALVSKNKIRIVRIGDENQRGLMFVDGG